MYAIVAISFAAGCSAWIDDDLAASSSISPSSRIAFCILFILSFSFGLFGRPPRAFAYSVLASSFFFFRKNPPAKQINTATPATIAEPTIPETEVPTGESLPENA